MRKEEIIALIPLLFFMYILILIIGSIIYEDIFYEKYYSYVDLDNNEGTAINCLYTDKSGRSGGMGSPTCILSDGTILSVKTYKYHIYKK